jgi:nicotinamide/nicotinate riboside kinase
LLKIPIVHQDRFFKPDSQIPTVNGISNWDCPEAIDFDTFHTCLGQMKLGSIQELLGPNRPKLDLVQVNVLNPILMKCIEKIKNLGVELMVIDGFMLYHYPETVSFLDCKLFLKARFETLLVRRNSRNSYKTTQGIL